MGCVMWKMLVPGVVLIGVIVWPSDVPPTQSASGVQHFVSSAKVVVSRFPILAPRDLPNDVFSSSPISLVGDCGWNVKVALDANGGALRNVVLPPMGYFSFNQSVGDPSLVPYRLCVGVPAGNWCNLAARYSQVARKLGLNPVFQDHGMDLGAGRENAVLIWNISGIPGQGEGRQDLEVTNTTGRAIHFQARDDGKSAVIVGWSE